MALLCKLFGHKYRARIVDLKGVIRNNGLEFDPSYCSKITEDMRISGESPMDMYVCERCGKSVSHIDKFLNLYRT